MGNQTKVMGFILLGFSFHFDVQVALFAAFLLVFTITLLGNLIIISLITTTPKLHTPMYFFLFNLSCLDIGLTSVTVPRLLADLLKERKYITFNECITQVFAFLFLASTEISLLTAMSYDRYVAICHPLKYTIIMNSRFCLQLLAISWMASFIYSFILSFQVSQLRFCGDNVIDNFLCEIPTLLKLSCGGTFSAEIVLFTLGGCISLITFTIKFMSYVHIIRVILKIPSVEGRRKVFSTCSAHLMVVFLFYSTGASTHMKPTGSSIGQDKVASLFYTIFAPMLNPIIYSLRNKEVKKAFKKAVTPRQVYM